ncbi:MAG: hypothetical protein WC608_03570 [Parcubacteria group bacterium]
MEADTLNCACFNGTAPTTENITEYIDVTVGNSSSPTQAETNQCSDLCKSKSYSGGSLMGKISTGIDMLSRWTGYYSPGNVAQRNVVDPLKGALGTIFKGLLVIVLIFVGMLLSVAASIFEWITQVGNFKSVVDGPTVYTAWQNVRDVLNIAFILVLLYSAFCTILQIESYNYKKILLKLVIMALLVNFSFPITRFIIDTSNVLMYTIIQTLLPDQTSKLFSAFSNPSITAILNQGTEASGVSLLASIVFVFILAITLLAIAILFVIRMIVLTILIIFSPLAFVATIFPDTGSYSSKWWDNLFKYSFFGPIMMFMLYISAQIMVSTIGINKSLTAVVQKNSIEPNLVAAMAEFSVPIVILWMGIGMAASMSGAAGSAVISGAQKFIKGAGKKFSGYNAIKKQYDAFAGARKKREEAKARNRFGGKVGDFTNKAQDTVIAGIPGVGGAARKRLDEMERKKIQEIREEWKKIGGASDVQLNDHLNSHDSAKRKAAAMEMAEKNGFGDGTNPAADLARYKSAFAAIENDPVYKKLFDEKVKEKHVRLIIADEIPTKGLAAAYDDNLKNMTADQLAKQTNLLDKDEFHDNFMQTKKISDPNFIIEVAKRATGGVRNDWKRAVPNRNYTI